MLLAMCGSAGVSGNAACCVWQSCLPCVVMLLRVVILLAMCGNAAVCGNAACYVC